MPVRWSSAWAEARELIWARRWRLAAGLVLMLVSRRRRLLDYIREQDPGRYVDLITRLNIRK